ncbi:hypothetical protein NKG05_19930 [Oerskovia sp. M15]
MDPAALPGSPRAFRQARSARRHNRHHALEPPPVHAWRLRATGRSRCGRARGDGRSSSGRARTTGSSPTTSRADADTSPNTSVKGRELHGRPRLREGGRGRGDAERPGREEQGPTPDAQGHPVGRQGHPVSSQGCGREVRRARSRRLRSTRPRSRTTAGTRAPALADRRRSRYGLLLPEVVTVRALVMSVVVLLAVILLLPTVRAFVNQTGSCGRCAPTSPRRSRPATSSRCSSDAGTTRPTSSRRPATGSASCSRGAGLAGRRPGHGRRRPGPGDGSGGHGRPGPGRRAHRSAVVHLVVAFRTARWRTTCAR